MTIIVLCGGPGKRMKPITALTPKPLVPISGVPLLLHIVRYFTYYGFDEFIFCLGHHSQQFIDRFQLERSAYERFYGSEWLAADWNIQLVTTSPDATITERLYAARSKIRTDHVALVYGDGLTDLNWTHYQAFGRSHLAPASLVTVPLAGTAHTVTSNRSLVTHFYELGDSTVRVNTGYVVMPLDLMDRIRPGEGYVNGFLSNLASEGLLAEYIHSGYWYSVDTIGDLAELNYLALADAPPWYVWA